MDHTSAPGAVPAPVRMGLTSAEVGERRARGQVNLVEESTSRSLGSIVRANVFTLFNAILVVAIAVVLLMGSGRDAVFGAVMVLNALIGIASEWRAKRTLDALAIVDAPRALVHRDGAPVEVALGDLVLDDVVDLRLGDQVPVDGEVLSSRGLEVDESLLTGESVPVRKEPGDTVLAGTAVVAGGGAVHATAVGEDLYAQGITRQARQFSLATSEIQQGIDRVLRVISWVIVPVVLLMVWSQTRVAGADPDAWRHALVLAVASVVGMIPQGLVLLTSMNFALGSATLARRGVLVQELPAVEVLARVDVLCLDKTGTLTTGGIRARAFEAVPSPGVAGSGGVAPADGSGLPRDARRALAELSADGTNATARAISEALSGDGDPTVGTAAGEQGDSWSVPFNSARKWSAWGDDRGAWVLGAPEVVVDPAQAGGPAALRRSGELAGEGLRVVCLVRAPGADRSQELPDVRRPVLLVVLEEDVRPDARETLEYFRAQGVHVRVISGDNPVTVATISREVGLEAPGGGEARVCDARTLPADLASQDFVRAVDCHDVFGRVSPEQKRAMVHALQSLGHTVAMTGDGVNDTLALKDADLGIAMGNGAGATKAVAQLVLVGGRFSVLPGVVAEGRRIIANMERVAALFLAKTTYAAVLAVAVALLTWQYPFLPRHYTYFDAFTIGIPAFFIALGPNTRRYVPGFLGRTLLLAVPSGVIISVAVMVSYTEVGRGTVAGQTAATLTLVIAALWLLSITARPLVPWRVGLLVLMLAGAVVGVLIEPVRAFFALEWPVGHQWATIIVVGLAAGLLIEVAHRLLPAAGRVRPGRRRGSTPSRCARR